MSSNDSTDSVDNTKVLIATALIDHRVAHIEKELKNLMEERDKALRWGILTLGAAVITLGSIIFKFVAEHIKL